MLWIKGLLVAVGLVSAAATNLTLADENPADAAVRKADVPLLLDDVTPEEWGIRNGCIRTHQIKSVKFLDDQSALITMKGGKTILMLLERRCFGIKREGFAYKSTNGALCSRFDVVRVLRQGHTCQIESFEPYLTLDEPRSGNDQQESE